MSGRGGARGIVEQVVDRLDFAALGRLYCDFGGDAFWADRRAPLVDLGLRWGEALARRLPPGGASMYLGAGVAELPALIVERQRLQRRLLVVSQREEECRVLNAALDGVVPDLRWVAGDGRVLVGDATFDHLACVSVLSDPESFPVCSGVGYGRLHPAQVSPGDLQAEQECIRALLGAVLARLQRPAWITTTVEEVPWFLAWAEAQQLAVVADDEMVDTAIVGDPIGFLRVG